MQPLSRRLTAATATTALAAALAGAAPAAADPVTLDDAELTNQATWYFEFYEDGDLIEGEPTVSIDEAELGTQNDALDGAYEFSLDGRVFADRDTGDLDGRDLVVGPAQVSGLETMVIYRSMPKTSVLRMLIRVKNRGDREKTRSLRLLTNVGSDSSTVVAKTSSGDDRFKPSDRWVISADSLETPGDPVVTQVHGGKGGAARAVAERYDDDYFQVRTRVQVPAHATRYVLLYLQVSPTVPEAKQAAKAFNDRNLSRQLLGGTSEGLQNKVLNWDL